MGFAASTVLRRGIAAARESGSGPEQSENEIRIALVRTGDREGEKEGEEEGERGYKRIGDERRRRNRDRGG